MDNKKYVKFIHTEDEYTATSEMEVLSSLTPGVYKFNFHQQKGFWFSAIKTNYDQIVHLPSTSYDQTIKDVSLWLSGAAEQKFKDWGFVYKRSILLEGPPGGGKSVTVNRVIEQVIEAGGVVVFNPRPDMLEIMYKMLDDVQPNVKTLVVWEEFDGLVKNYEEILLNVLDGEIQKRNVLYLMTTNFVQNIPARILRPGRTSQIVHVDFPDEIARIAYLKAKNVPENKINEIAKKTKGFSIDELKEIVLAHFCLDQSIERAVTRVQQLKNNISYAELEKDLDDEEDYLDKALSRRNNGW